VSSKNAKPQYQANIVASSNGRKVKKMNKESSSSFNWVGKEWHWSDKHLLGKAPIPIWILCNEVKHRGIEMEPKWGLLTMKSLTL
jgi:hypothetical protein